MSATALSLESFQSFGDLLKYLRRREHLTQLELSITVGYSEAQISRLEQNQRLPDLAALKALFIPALHVENEPELTARFLHLAQSARQEDAPVPGVSPYKGLLYFDRAESDVFFGRESLTARLAERVTALAIDGSSRFLAVVGASGSGKSSLLRAGLAATLQRAGWEIYILTPTLHPLKILEANYHPGAAVESSRHLVLVDQFEETFTHCREDRERLAFVERLLSIALDPLVRTTVVIALRADFYPHCAQYPLLREAVAAQQEYIGQMTKPELRRAIEEPARRGSWELESGLVEILLSDLGADGAGQPEPGALPLLSHALLATWERRRGRTLTIQGYRASGGIRGAIAETAESVFTDQLDGRQQDLARDIFLRLTELGEGTEDTRRRAALNELVRQSEEAGSLRAVLDTLAEARLITLNEDSAEVSHEALIREWQRLREWLTQDREGLRLHRHLTNSAHEWEVRGRDPAELYRGARLGQAREWALINEGNLNASERVFLEASAEREQHEALEREAQRQRELRAAQEFAKAQSRAASQLRRRAVFLAGAFFLAILLAAVAVFFGNEANQNAVKAQDNAQVAQQNSIIAEQNAASANASEQKVELERSIATSRELAAAAVANLDLDPQLSLLLSLQAVRNSNTLEAENALHRSILASRVVFTVHHDAAAWDVVYSPDGKRFATGSQDKTVKIWDAATGRLLLTLAGHTDSVNNIAFSPDGRQIATSSDDHTAKVWDATTGKELFTLRGHQDIVWGVAYSPDGKLIATAGAGDRTARLWDATTGQQRRVLQYTDTVSSVAFSPDGTRLATGTGQIDTVPSKGKVVIWDVSTGKELSALSSGILSGVAGVDFSPDGTRVAGAAYMAGQAIVWDLRTGTELDRFTDSLGVMRVSFSPDGKWLAASAGNQIARIYDLATGRELFSLAAHNLAVNSVAFSPDGKRLATASTDGTVSVWDLTPTRELFHLPPPSPEAAGYLLLAYSPDGRQILANSSMQTARIWDARSGAELPTFGDAHTPVLASSYGRDGKLVEVVLQDQTAEVVDVQTGASGPELAGPVDASGNWAISPDGTRLVSYRPDSTISIWDLTNGKKLLTFTGNRNGSTNLVDCVHLPGNGECIVFSPDGKRLVTSDADTKAHNQFDTGDTNGNGNTTATVWDTLSGQRLLTLASQSGVIYDISYSPDGRRIATASDGEADIWDALTGRLLLRFLGHSNGVYAIKFSPDGKEIATQGADGSLKLWNAATGATLLALPIEVSIYGDNLAFSPDGKQLAEADGTGIDVFVLPIQDVVALAKSRLTRSLTDSECQQYLHVESCPASP